jgi:cytochrome P450
MDKSPPYSFLHPFLGLGLLTSQGDKWQQRRRILTPTFHFNILEQFLIIFQEEAERLIETIRETTRKQRDINVGPISTQFTLNTVSGMFLYTSI